MTKSVHACGLPRAAAGRRRRVRSLLFHLPVLLVIWLSCSVLAPTLRAASAAERTGAEVHVPRVKTPPRLEDFLNMEPPEELAKNLAKIDDLRQYIPKYGEPITQATHVYLGYDDKHFYVVFVCFDSDPSKIRARLGRRDEIFDDDYVEIDLDTFHDHRRAYQLWSNPLGVQLDNIWTEGQGPDFSFDTVWQSRGQVTEKGYVVWMAIPFDSLRFKRTDEQTWGMILWRVIPRLSEEANWPGVYLSMDGLLSQEGTVYGISGISPGRNVQLVPYAFARSHRALDAQDPEQVHFVSDRLDPQAGLDAKFILKDSFVLDTTVNPDFSQVESDEPQITVNQRFEVFFPEKRPFFLENAGYFNTPINLLFTRRIADPQYGARLTGKRGPYSLGILLADDQAPGKSVLPGDPLFGKSAKVGVFRLQREVFKQSSLGVIYTDRELAGGFNRVGGLDAHFKLSRQWAAALQGVTSSTRFPDGSRLAGPAYKGYLRHTGQHLYYDLEYDDRSPGFFTDVGFLAENQVQRPFIRSRTITAPNLRTDMRSASQYALYQFRPENKWLISWGPSVSLNRMWDHSGRHLDEFHDVGMMWELPGFTYFEVFQTADRELLRAQDFPSLTGDQAFSHRENGLFVGSQILPKLSIATQFSRGTGINFLPPSGQPPALAQVTRANVDVILRPLRPLRVENYYLLERLTDRADGGSIFNNHILRSAWNWQFNREFSLRVILQYDTVLANANRTSLQTTKKFNADFLFMYLLNPWTAVYVGYNGNYQNVDLLNSPAGAQLIRTRGFLNDARQFFVKFSYLLRF
ncbi:MAG: carbohydrate binding family 9 domain-containing protein [Acidobacteriia bacterium]|nr:carbohydrate binding family 9 domain-containing protein [Terriglobia bacterium]